MQEVIMITKDMTVSEVLEMDDKYEDIFAKHLLSCAGCPGAQMETLEQAAEGHGIELEKLLADLNGAK